VAAGTVGGLLGSVAGISIGLLAGRFINEINRFLEALFALAAKVFHGQPIEILNSGYYLDKIPIVIEWKTVALIGLFTVLASAFASWIPARQAAQTHPTEILRKF
jgi:ABC-type lipoprotein release transport system permease subunit